MDSQFPHRPSTTLHSVGKLFPPKCTYTGSTVMTLYRVNDRLQQMCLTLIENTVWVCVRVCVVVWGGWWSPSSFGLYQTTWTSELLSSFMDPFVRYWDSEGKTHVDIIQCIQLYPGTYSISHWVNQVIQPLRETHPTCCPLVQDRQHVMCCSLPPHCGTGYTRTLLYPATHTAHMSSPAQT